MEFTGKLQLIVPEEITRLSDFSTSMSGFVHEVDKALVKDDD